MVEMVILMMLLTYVCISYPLIGFIFWRIYKHNGGKMSYSYYMGF